MAEAIVALVGALVVALIGVVAGRAAEARRQAHERELALARRGEVVDRYRQPLANAAFAEYLAQYDRFRRWCDPFEQGLLGDRLAYAERLQLAQHALCDVVRELDPQSLQYEPGQIKYVAVPLPVDEA